jgi:hypothetical protein
MSFGGYGAHRVLLGLGTRSSQEQPSELLLWDLRNTDVQFLRRPAGVRNERLFCALNSGPACIYNIKAST